MSIDHTLTDSSLQEKRAYAAQALERAQDRVRELGSDVKDLAGKGFSSVSESALAAQRRLGNYASATSRYVADQPVKSALIAAAIGAAVAGLIIAARHNRNR